MAENDDAPVSRKEYDELRATLRSFEDKHRPAVQAAWAAYKASFAANWKAHAATALIGAGLLKLYPFVAGILGKLIA